MRRSFLIALVACMLVLQVPVQGQQACREGFPPSIGTIALFLVGTTSPGEGGEELEVVLEDRPADARVRFEVTVEDDDEVVAVSVELVHGDIHYAIRLPISALNKTIQPSSGNETSVWTLELPVSSPALLTGTYDVHVRAQDRRGCASSVPAAGEDADVELTVTGNEAELGQAGEDPFMYVPDKTDPSRPVQEALKYAATGGRHALVTDYAGEIVLKGDERLRVFLDETRLKYPHKVTYQVDLGGGAFTAESVFDHRVGLGPEILGERPQEVIIRYYSRDPDVALPQFVVDANNDGRQDRVAPAMVLRLEHVEVDRSAPDVLGIDTNGTVFPGHPFNVTVTLTDATAVSGSASFPGAVRGAQVRTDAPDLDQGLTTFRDAVVRYDDRGVVFDPADRPFDLGDVLYLDADGDNKISAGDVVLSGVHAGGVVRAGFEEMERTLHDPPRAFVDAYLDVDGDRAYGIGDQVVLDDPGGRGDGLGELSVRDLRMSGGQGRLVLDQEAGGTLRDGRLGTFAFHDANGDGVFNLTESVYYTGTSFVNVGDVRVANAVRGQLHRATNQSGGAMEIEFGPFVLAEVGNHTLRLDLTDAVGNRHVSQNAIAVAPPYTTLVLRNVTVMTPTRLAGEPVEFEAQVDQPDGVAAIDVDLAFEADGIRQDIPATILPNGTSLVVYENDYRPGRYVMQATIVPPAVMEVQNGSVLGGEVAFEVFFGKVETPGGDYWIRANDLGLAAMAVHDPGDDEEAYELERRTIDGRPVQAFDVNGTQLYWDPSMRNETGRAITVFEEMPAGPTDKTDDSPLPLALLLAAVAVALARRRSSRR